MEVSQLGRDFIRGWEALRLTAYNDGYGFATVGWGHRCLPSDQIRIGDTISLERAVQLFDHDIAIPERILDYLGVDLEQHEFDALASLIWNIGGSAFAGSTIKKFLLGGRKASIADEFGRWVRSAGKVSPGLVERREAERDLFLAGVYDWEH